MPRIRYHTKTSSSIGAISAGIWSHKNGDSTCEVICSILGGYVGGRAVAGWPDIIDRPTSPSHRGIGHGVLPNSALAKGLQSTFFKFLSALQQQVDEFKKVGTLPYLVLALLAKFIWGIIVGAVLGYGTHLLTDFFTANGLPIIC
jgi:hypothetical protein